MTEEENRKTTTTTTKWHAGISGNKGGHNRVIQRELPAFGATYYVVFVFCATFAWAAGFLFVSLLLLFLKNRIDFFPLLISAFPVLLQHQMTCVKNQQ